MYNPSKHLLFAAAEIGSSPCLQILFNSKLLETSLHQYYWIPVLKEADNHLFQCGRLLLQYLANTETEETKNLLQLLFNLNVESISQ